MADSQVYVRDPDYAWIPATLDRLEGKKAYVTVPRYATEQAITSDGGRSAKSTEELVVNLKDYQHSVLPLQNVGSNGALLEFADMVKLPYLHEAAILYNLKKRHQGGEPYTRTGDIIIAVNPFQWFTELYTEKKRAYYSNRLVWEDHEKDPRDGMEPHVYEISALSYKGLAFDGDDQSILVSGESGAGKTETVKICMNHIASVQKGPSKKSGSGGDLDPVVQKVVESNPLLEAFGNAKTRRNDNSSRFGKYLQLQFDTSEAGVMAFGDKSVSKCRLAGSECEVYLLEKNRIIAHDSEERTFHIFYQLLAAPDSDKGRFWSSLRGSTMDSFKYVGHTNTTKIEGMSDADHFKHTCDTLALIGVKGEKLTMMMQAICMVMQLGNLGFKAKGDDASECATPAELKDLADLMKVSVGDLSLAVTERTMKTRNETYKVPLKLAAAKDAADALAKEIYGRVFLWLVSEINSATRAQDNYKGGSMSSFGLIGLLDIFGFESFVVNRFEQLCINYANEKLQQKFTEDIFRSVQKEYEAEGIALAEIWYDDNTDVLDLIESRTGLLALLNEECVRPKGSDFDFVQKALQQNAKSPCLIVNKMDRMSFGVHHYAGKVMYDADGFVTGNQDMLPTDLTDLCGKSDNFILSHDPSANEDNSSRVRGTPKRAKSNIVGATVWGKYKEQLRSLMTNLRKTNSRYIRCIKPNMKKVPVIMEHLPTVEQLRCAGVVAAVTLSRSAFPNRLDNSVVRYRYMNMWDQNNFRSQRDNTNTPEEALAADCTAMMSCALKCKELVDEESGRVMKAFVVGKTRTYFRAGALEYLEANRLESGLDGPATSIQRYVRGFLVRKNWGAMVKGAAKAQAEKKAEEERRAREAKERAAEEIRKKKAEAARKVREEKARKEREEKERLEREEKALQLKREAEAKKKVEEEEKEHQSVIKKLQKKIKKLDREIEEKTRVNEKKIKHAEEAVEELVTERDDLLAQFEIQMKEAEKLPKGEIVQQKKKLDESEKIVAYVRKENKKVRDQTEKMKEDMVELKEQNNRLIEANASAGASLDSLDKQKKNIAVHNSRLDENLRKYKAQNLQLKADLENRDAYYKAETRIRAEYEKAMDQIIELMESRCDDSDLVEDITNAQIQCEAMAENKLMGGGSPGLTQSDVSDF